MFVIQIIWMLVGVRDNEIESIYYVKGDVLKDEMNIYNIIYSIGMFYNYIIEGIVWVIIWFIDGNEVCEVELGFGDSGDSCFQILM